MIEVRETEVFKNWFHTLRDRQARARIDARIRRVSLGNFGDVKSVGGGILELRIDYGTGYRVYLKKKGSILVILLCGGDKSTQTEDIKKAHRLSLDIEENST